VRFESDRPVDLVVIGSVLTGRVVTGRVLTGRVVTGRVVTGRVVIEVVVIGPFHQLGKVLGPPRYGRAEAARNCFVGFRRTGVGEGCAIVDLGVDAVGFGDRVVRFGAPGFCWRPRHRRSSRFGTNEPSARTGQPAESDTIDGGGRVDDRRATRQGDGRSPHLNALLESVQVVGPIGLALGRRSAK
jgi:hypothetical protein